MKQTAMQKLLEEVILEREKSISVEFREALDFVITAIKKDYKEMEKEHMLDITKQAYGMGRSNYTIKAFNEWFEQFKNK